MWPTQVTQSTPPSRWSERGRGARLLALLGVAALLVSASVATWLAIRNAQSATPVYGNPSSSPGVTWTWDGARYAQVPATGSGPMSNNADMAYDRTRGLTVLWDHGCVNMVMGFQGGCATHVNRTWTWDGVSWTGRSPASAPEEIGQGAMVYDSQSERVVYVNGEGRAWTWTGADWTTMAMPGGPQIARRGSGPAATTFVVGYDEARGQLVFVTSTSTWLWNGKTWSEARSRIGLGEAGAQARAVFDRVRGALVYVGSRFTWTWDGALWQKHDQPAISAGALGYDPIRGTTMLVQQDSSVCDRTACRTTTWTWGSGGWAQVPITQVPLLPLTRSSALDPPMAFDEARGVMVIFVSAS
jgi:hypothetical protein